MSRLVYGVNPVLALLAGGREPVDELILASGRKPNRLKDLLALARAAGVKIRRRPRPELTRLAGTPDHQGVVARVGEFAYLSLEELLGPPGPDLVVVLDRIQDPQNLGAIARTALAAGAGGLILPKDRAAGVTAAALKASAGALSRLPVARVTNLNQTALTLKEAGYWLLGASPKAEKSLFELPGLPARLAVLIGSEGQGLGRALSEKCDYLVSIPLEQGVESLNASAAAAVVLFEIKKKTVK